MPCHDEVKRHFSSLTSASSHPLPQTPFHLGAKKPINRNHINIFLTALAGQSSQGRTPAHPRDKRDKMAILLWNSTEKGRFVPGTGPNLSPGGVPFVPGTVPVCPGHRPAQNVYVYWFFLADSNMPMVQSSEHGRSGPFSEQIPSKFRANSEQIPGRSRGPN